MGPIQMKIAPGVLVVDDDLDWCQNMSDILSDRGYRVDTAPEGLTALRLLDQQTYDIALLDLKMPGMDGLTLCREATRRRPAMVAVLITGYPEDILPTEARAAGVDQVFPKPVNIPRLLVRIEEALAS
jgi:two-component system, NtrC family, response regulator HydG